MTTLNAKNLTLDEVHRLFSFQKQDNNSLASLLSLEPLTELEQQELAQTRQEFDNHLTSTAASEGQVKLVAISPLLRLAGFYRYPLQVIVEEGIARINISDEGTIVTGRLDILAIHKARQIRDNVPFWILVIESKNSSVSPSIGLPQLLSYAYKSLEYQESVWGLATNGELYRFVYIQAGNPPTYQLMPFLGLTDSESSIELLQVLKAICKLQHNSDEV
ncbi:MAG: restriction endonuclease subunit R [Merismopedia sp. SIO2A8]|nr:restriction endonuclease subunit R [Symploca sp. SIO2B6]NET48677.1 restriction endonuclease subunit R [Merismopedia sp. SIO2A8]